MTMPTRKVIRVLSRLGVGALLALVFASGCSKAGRSLLRADITANPQVTGLSRVTLRATAGGSEVGNGSFPWTSPTLSVGIYLSDSVKGTVSVEAIGLNAAGTEVARAPGKTAVIEPGQPSAIVALVLAPSTAPGNDGGVSDAETGAGSDADVDVDAVPPNDTASDPGLPIDLGVDVKDVAAESGVDVSIDMPVDVPVDLPIDLPIVVTNPPGLGKCVELEHAGPKAQCDPVTTGQGDYAVYSVAFSPDGALMASAGSDGRIKLWKVQGTTLVPEGRVITAMAQSRVAFSPDGKQLAAGGDQGDLFIYDLTSSTKAALVGHTDRIRGVAYHSDGNRLVTVDRSGVVKSWNVATRATTTTMTLYAGMSTPYSLSIVKRNAGTALWAAVGLTKVSAPVAAPGDAGVLPSDAAYVWFGDLNNPAQFTLLNADPDEVDATAISPDDRLLLAGGQGSVAGVWNIQNPAVPTKTGMVAAALNTNTQAIPLTALSFGADGHWLAAAYGGPFYGGSLRIIDATSWQPNGLANSTYYGVSAVLRPQGNIFVAGEFACGLLSVCAD